MDKSDAIRLRKLVQKYAKQGMPLAKIARKLGVSRPFVHRWKNAEDPADDRRGWEKGKKRTYTEEQEQIVIEHRKKLSRGFFSEQEPSKRI